MQLVVGRVTRPHGVRGEVSVEVRTDDPDLRFAVGRVIATDPAAAGPLTVESVRWHSGRLLIRFAGIADRSQAEELRGTWLTLDSAEVGSTDDPDEFHDHELIGLAVVTTLGEPVGRVTDVRHFGQDLLVIEPAPARSPAGPRRAQARPRRAQFRRASPDGLSPDGLSPDEPSRRSSRRARGFSPTAQFRGSSDGPASSGPARVGPTGRPRPAAARVAPRRRPERSPATAWVANCSSRSWPRSCLKSTWPRGGSSSTRRRGCWSWAPGNLVRPVAIQQARAPAGPGTAGS